MEEKMIYIKAPMSVSITEKKLFLKDVLEITGTDKKLSGKIENLLLYTFSGEKKEKRVFSIMKIIRMIQEKFPGLQINSVGETDFVVEYAMEAEKARWKEMTKLLLLCLIVFMGSAFTIMTFNTDVSVGEVFDHFYRIIAGGRKGMGALLEISYSIGIFVGIMGFYNHLSRKKRKEDPTPIHVEMRNYEDERNKAIMEDAARDDAVIK